MNIGQMSLKKISNKADYLQLDICGLNKEEVLIKYRNYNTDIPVILHGDWDKRPGVSENNLESRYEEYINIILELKEITKVLGITIHPPYRKKVPILKMINICNIIKDKTNVDVFVENRSNKKINVSLPEEVIAYSKKFLMTIDIPQLYIACGYYSYSLIETLKLINMDNVREIHFANIKKDGSHTYVARKLNDGDLDLIEIMKYLNKEAYYTLEILGQVNTFENMVDLLKEMEES